MKRLTLLFFSLMFIVGTSMAQRMVSGNVTGEQGEPLIGATVLVKGTTMGTVTDFDGNFELNVPDEYNMLMVSFVGYTDQDIDVSVQNYVAVSMAENSELLGDVVVTALGISREKKALGYSTQEVGGDEVTRAKDLNFMNSLSGKVSGVDIQSSGTFGGSTNVVIRGYKSLTGNNQALFVVDGVPISNATDNTSNQRTGRSGYDYGNAAMDVNPEDIESINVLKGAAASALYGARGANGVILITTKKGAKNKGLGITVNTGWKWSTADKSTMPEYQTEYGPGYEATGLGFYAGNTPVYGLEYFTVNGNEQLGTVMYEDASFGPRFDPSLQVYDYRSIYPELSTYGQTFPFVAAENDSRTFVRTGLSQNYSIGLDGGSENFTYRLGYTNTNAEGILPNSRIVKNVVNVSAGYDINDRWWVGASGNLILQDARGRFGTGYDNTNPFQSFRQWYQVTTDMVDQRETYEQTGKNISWNPFAQLNPASSTQPHYFDNYYFNRYENYNSDNRDRLIGNIKTTYDFNDNLQLMFRIARDGFTELREERIAVGSVDIPKYERFNKSFSERNYDLWLRYNKEFGADESFGFSGLLGTNIRREKYSSVRASTNGGLGIADVYTLSNTVAPILAPTEIQYQKGVNGFFGQASFDWNRTFYLDMTGRVDVSSTLPKDNNTYFYPSVSASFIPTELWGKGGSTFAKLRFNYAAVGNDAPAQALTDYFVLNTPFNGTGLASYPSTEANPDLKPENTSSLEFGAELNFWNNRLRFDASYYQSKTTDLITPVNLSASTGLYRKYYNAGSIENKGFEISVGGRPVQTDNFTWDINLNWSKNNNEVVELRDGLERLELASVQGGIRIVAEPGETYGSILGTNYVYHENGEKIVYPHWNGGMRYRKTATPEIIGNIQPDWRMGIQNNMNIYGVQLSFLIDIKQGGDFFSLDTWYGNATGIYANSAGTNDKGNPVRDNPADGGGKPIGGVTDDGVANTEYGFASDVYSSFGYVYAPNAYHVHDASFVKLREMSLGYEFDMENNGFLQGIGISLIGRNLWIISSSVDGTDPEAGLSAGNIQGYQSGAYPAVREIGFNLRFKF